MSLVLQSSGGGQITIQEPATASNFTQTLPAATGTVMVSGNQPAFSAYRSTIQTFSTTTWIKMQCQTEEFDTANAYDNATNYRFTPQVAGYYQASIQASLTFTSTSGTTGVALYKNGSPYKYLQVIYATFNSGTQLGGSALVYCDGSTDYLEAFVYCAGTSPELAAASTGSYFQASMVRAA
jgi:hypothetical protein